MQVGASALRHRRSKLCIERQKRVLMKEKCNKTNKKSQSNLGGAVLPPLMQRIHSHDACASRAIRTDELAVSQCDHQCTHNTQHAKFSTPHAENVCTTSCAMSTADESNHPAAGTLHPHRSAAQPAMLWQ